MWHLACEVWLRLFFKDRTKYQFETKQRRFVRVMLPLRVIISNNDVGINSCMIEFFIVRKSGWYQ